MEILNTISIRDQYPGMTKVTLTPYWNSMVIDKSTLTVNLFKQYADMRQWLNDTNTNYRFGWINGGVYIPDYVWLDNDSAVAFTLKYSA